MTACVMAQTKVTNRLVMSTTTLESYENSAEVKTKTIMTRVFLALGSGQHLSTVSSVKAACVRC